MYLKISQFWLILFLASCVSNQKPEELRFEHPGDYSYSVRIQYSNEYGGEEEIFRIFLDNALDKKGQRNCFKTTASEGGSEVCGLSIGGWRPWGSRLWISLDTFSPGRILLGRVRNDSASGKVIESGFSDYDVGTFTIFMDSATK